MARFDDVPSKTQPLRSDTSKGDTRLRPLTVPQEQEVSLAAVNSEPDLYPVGPDGVSDDFNKFSPVVDPFGNLSDTVNGISSTTNASGKTSWYAIVRPQTGLDQIWSSPDKVSWNQTSITFDSDTPTSLIMTGIESHDGEIVVSAGSSYYVGNSTGFTEYQADYGIDSDGLTEGYHSTYPNSWVFNTTGSNVTVKIGPITDSADWTPYPTPETFNSIAVYSSMSTVPGGLDRPLVVGIGSKMWITEDLNNAPFRVRMDNPALEMIKVKVIEGRDGNSYCVLLAFNTVSNLGEIWYGEIRSVSVLDQPLIKAVVLNSSGARFTDIDYGNGQWVVSTDDPGGRMWYSDENNPSRFYYGVSSSLPSYRSHFIQYGGGFSYEWLSASKTSSTIVVSDAAPKYDGVLMPDSLGPDSILIGEYTDTYYDSNGLQTSVEPLYQYRDSDFAWGSTYQRTFVGTDSVGDIWEMNDSASLEMGSRFATYKYLKDGAGTFRLEETDNLPDDYHYWIKDIFTDTISDDTAVGYSIIRKNSDPTLTQRDDVLTLEYGTPSVWEFTQLKSLSEDRLNGVVGSMIAYANNKLGIGNYLLLHDPTTPYDAPYNETGGWLRKGYALDTRKVSYGDSTDETVNTYVLWCKVTDQPLGEPYYTDSDYYTPEGIDSGYVYP